MIIAITGYPGTGKTTLAWKLTSLPIETDKLAELPWNDQPAAGIKAVEDFWNEEHMSARGQTVCIIEGILVARMIRRGWSPDLLIVLDKQWREPKPSEASIRSQVDRAVAEFKGVIVRGYTL